MLFHIILIGKNQSHRKIVLFLKKYSRNRLLKPIRHKRYMESHLEYWNTKINI